MKKYSCLAALSLIFFISGMGVTGLSAEENRDAIARFAMIVGSNNGGPGRVLLRYAVSDANAFREVMNKMGGVPEDNTLPLFDPDLRNFSATMTALNRKISEARPKHKKIEMIFYYSGHSDEEGILLGHEKISYRDIRKAIEKMPADVKIAILDSCSSGAFTQIKGGKMHSPFLLDASYDMKGYAFMTSSSADEVSQESDKIRGSFFTHFLLTGLRGAADTRQDGRITLNEAYQFAYTETLARTEKTVSGPQHPHYNIQMTGTGDVVITDVRKSTSGVIIDTSVEGKIFIHDDDQRLVGEFNKPYGRSMQIGLERGKYRIVNMKAGGVYEVEADLSGGPRTLREKDFAIAARETTLARGDGARDDANRYLVQKLKLEFSGYGAPVTQFSWLEGGMYVFSGARGGLIINERFVAGIAGYGVVTPYRNELDGERKRLEIGFGGMLFEWYFFPRKLFNLSFEFTVGAGGIAKYDDDHKKNAMVDEDFFFCEPGIGFYLNLTKFCRIGAGFSYRYVRGIDKSGMSDSDLRGFSANIIVAFGKF